MALSRFPAKNHPQQSRRWGADDEIDDRATHPLDFSAFDGPNQRPPFGCVLLTWTPLTYRPDEVTGGLFG